MPTAVSICLTASEREIVSLVAQGYSNGEIAKRLFTSEQDVRKSLRIIFDKLGVSDKLELVLYAIFHKL